MIIIESISKKNISSDKSYFNKVSNIISFNQLPEILIISSLPPKECGIATFSQDLINSLNNKFYNTFKLKFCAVISNQDKEFNNDIDYLLNTDESEKYKKLAEEINSNLNIEIILLQHEFGFFSKNEGSFANFLKLLNKPIIIVFHTVLPNPNEILRKNVINLASCCASLIVMTKSSAAILKKDYFINDNKIEIIPHGTHLVKHLDKNKLKHKYNLKSRKVVSTFGLLSSGKSIESTLDALPIMIKTHPEIMFLIIGKTHPSIVKTEGEKYRQMLEQKVVDMKLENNVLFINYFLPLNILLEYLQLTDIYLFTSKDPNQAVSGAFSYAISCGCPIISTPIPHALEVIQNKAGIIIDFQNHKQLSTTVLNLLNNDQLLSEISLNGLHKMAVTAWENSAIAHANLFVKVSQNKIKLKFQNPPINLLQMKKMTTSFGIIQFSKLNQPDILSGYTLDDNARALIAMCQHYDLTADNSDLEYIKIYLNFIGYCWKSEGYFLNYVDENKEFTKQNISTNLADAFGRSLWALGYTISLGSHLPDDIINEAEGIYKTVIIHTTKIYSTRALAFVIKGIYYHNLKNSSDFDANLTKELTNRLVQMYRHESDEKWNWFESYLTYANSLLPEAMLCAWLTTGDAQYKEIAKSAFDFLLKNIFNENKINVISNKGWFNKKSSKHYQVLGGQQPIDVAYTLIALNKFYEVFKSEDYLNKIELSMNWFHGNNYLNQIIYNPCTGGCYDGLEDTYVNLNQGAESTVSYLMARLTIEKLYNAKTKVDPNIGIHSINQLELENRKKQFA